VKTLEVCIINQIHVYECIVMDQIVLLWASKTGQNKHTPL